MKIDREQIKFVLKSRNCLYLFFFVKSSQVMFASLPKTFTYSGALRRGKLAVEIVNMGLFWADLGFVNVRLPNMFTYRGALHIGEN